MLQQFSQPESERGLNLPSTLDSGDIVSGETRIKQGPEATLSAASTVPK